MSEFTIRSESVDVEQIMKQIRQRILEKRGADYTEDQIRELASVRLEKFLDPKNLRSDLLDQFRKSRPAPLPVPEEPPPPVITAPYTFDDQTLFTSHRGVLRLIRKLMKPLLKLMFNPNTLNQILHTQAQFNVDTLKRQSRQNIEQRHILRQTEHAMVQSRNEWNALYYEVLHNLVLETTRMGIEVQNLRMKAESLSSRLDFSERRVRALEGVVQYRPEVIRGADRHDSGDDDLAPAPQAATGSVEGFVPAGGGPQGQQGQGDGSGRKRRRRRRGRRGGQGAEGASGASGASGAYGAQGAPGAQGAQGTGAQDDGFDDGVDDEGGEEFDPMDAGAEAQEALEGRGAVTPAGAPEALEAPEAPQALEVPQAPEVPGSSDDDLQ